MLKNTGLIRKIDELGRVVLPIEVRRGMGIDDKEELEILVDEENRRVILQKYVEHCMRCGNERDLLKIKRGYFICKRCVDKLEEYPG